MKRLLLVGTVFLSTFCFSQDDIVLSQESANQKGITPTWSKCERSRFPLDRCFDQKLREHIIRNFQYPEAAISKKLSGTVVIEFMINKKGKVEVLEVNGGHLYLQKEATRIIRSIPKMKPAKWGKKPVAVAFTVPITFEKPR